MHLMHLATFPDTIMSMLSDLSDGPRRESDLNDLWLSYREWCNSLGQPFLLKIE